MNNYKQELISEMLICMKEADLDKWMTLVYSEDDLVNEAIRDWFQGRIQTQKVTDIQLMILDMNYEHSDRKVKCQLLITYEDYEPITEIHIYTFEFVRKRNRNCVVWLEKERKFIPFGSYDEKYQFVIRPMRKHNFTTWWKEKALVEVFVGSDDSGSAEKYARAVIRNVRFREGCPELECASLLSNMMSAGLNELQDQIYNADRKKLAANIYNATRSFFKVQLVRDDRDNTWSSKFVAPWYGFDELVELNKSNDCIKGSCFSFISFLYAMLRVCGFPEADIYQLRLINQDILLVFIEDQPYIIDSDNMTPWNCKSIYFRKRVSKMFTESWCIGDKNYVGLSEGELAYEMNRVQNCLTEFNFFEHKYNSREWVLPENNSTEAGRKSCFEIVKWVMKKASERTDSVYVWAKYAHQMLYVTKPEAYLQWSMQSKITAESLCQYGKFEEWLDMVRTFRRESIFSEDFRIMTADQCIRYKKGDSKSLLTLLYVWFVVKEKQKGILVFTTKGNYFVCVQHGKISIWDGESLEPCSEIDGNVILAFHHKESYYPLLYNRLDVRRTASELVDYMLYTSETRTKVTKYKLLLHLPKKFEYKLEPLKHLSKDSRVLILSPHYDDDVIGCGGIIRECCMSGCACSVVYFTDGTKNKAAIGKTNYKEIRKSEAMAALRELGDVNIYCLEETDGELSYSNRIVNELRKQILESGADTIFFPNMYDSYSDHSIVGKILSEALREITSVSKLYMYEIIEGLQMPNTYWEMDEAAIQSKQRAIGKHTTQTEYMDYPKIAEILNRTRGAAMGNEACEVFQKTEKEALYQYYNVRGGV